MKDIQIITLTTDRLKLVKPMAKVSILGLMVKFMMVNGTKVLSMGTEFGEVCIMILILESGDTQKLRGMEFILGRMVIDMKENGNAVSNMDKAQTFLQIKTFIQENIKMENLRAKVNILGKMVLFILVNLKMD